MIPEVSVILPVYNGAQYLPKAIDSVLAQSFTGFELIIINDGSTDNSGQVIKSYSDPRIVYIANEGNRGLVYSLNKAIEQSRGKYIARMDSDDICKRERLALQKKYLDENAAADVVACIVDFIDENDKPAGHWQTDQETVTAESIRKMLPKQNCVTHPSVMIRAEILKAYRYKAYQKNIEDYDLWLRITGDGKRIDKINQSLLLYRVHSQSVTSLYLKTANSFLKHFHCKRKYLYHSGKLNSFNAIVFVNMVKDLVIGLIKQVIR